MQKAKVLVVEDEWIVSEELKELLLKNNFEVIGQAENAEEALNLMEADPPDVALLDINIKGNIDGIELATEIQKTHQVAIIFITAFYDDYFLRRAKKVNPAAYIVKPFEERNLLISIDLAFEKLSRSKVTKENEDHDSYVLDDRIFVRDKQRFIKITINDIIYLEASGSYTKIHTIADKVYTLAINLSHIEDRLQHPSLLRIHRSYIVNIRSIDEIEGNVIKVKNTTISVSQSHREDLLNRIKLI